MINIWDSKATALEVNTRWTVTSHGQGQATYQCLLCVSWRHYWYAIAAFRSKVIWVRSLLCTRLGSQGCCGGSWLFTGQLMNVFFSGHCIQMSNRCFCIRITWLLWVCQFNLSALAFLSVIFFLLLLALLVNLWPLDPFRHAGDISGNLTLTSDCKESTLWLKSAVIDL